MTNCLSTFLMKFKSVTTDNDVDNLLKTRFTGASDEN